MVNHNECLAPFKYKMEKIIHLKVKQISHI